MKEHYKILFTFTEEGSWNTTDYLSRLESLRGRQDLERFYNPKFLDGETDRLRRLRNPQGLSFTWHTHNVPGEWMGRNIRNPNEVVPEPITLSRAIEALDSKDVNYLVVSTYLSGYSTFRDIARWTRRNRPEVRIVSGSVGALLDESQQLADYALYGNQIDDLRRIVGQPVDEKLQPVTVQADTETTFNGVTKKSSYALLVSSWGCVYGCDFCPSTAQFGKEYKAPFTAAEVKNAIVSARDKIDPKSQEFTVSVAEAQGLGNVKLWKEVFALCRDLPFQVDLVTTTSSKVIRRYSMDELTDGALRLSTVNIGVESLTQGYQKNEGVDLKDIFGDLQDSGINVVATYIVGFDWQTKENVRREAKDLKSLGASGYIVANLEMQPNTPIYDTYRGQGRLLDVPPELLNFYGYQAFTHPNFRPGFEDMLPLLNDVNEELAQGNDTMLANLRIFLRRRNKFQAGKRQAIQTMMDSFSQNDVADKFAAKLYFHLAFRQVDLFHPFIISTN